MKPITLAEATRKLPDLIDAALRGKEVIITKDGLSCKINYRYSCQNPSTR